MKKAVSYKFSSQKTFNIAFCKKFLFSFLVFITLITNISSSFAASGEKYGAGRIRSCNGNGEPEELTFDPFTSKDVQFVMSNPICLIIATTTYLNVKRAIYLMNKTCGTGSTIPRIVPSPINDGWDITRASIKAASTTNAACGSSVVQSLASWSIVIGQMGITYAVAEDVYKTTKVCGSEWRKPNPRKYNLSAKGREEEINIEIQNRLREFNINPSSFDRNKLGLNGLDNADQTYREWYYGGIEVEDKLPSSLIEVDSKTVFKEGNLFADRICRDPTRPKRADGKYPPQKYYLQGLEAGNFNCNKYKPVDNKDAKYNDLLDAYHCCQERSRSFICIDKDDEKVFCKAGQLCGIDGISFSPKLIEQERIICADTYSLCPYNFSLSGGTEYCDFYQDGIWNKDSGRWDLIEPSDIDSGQCANKSEVRNSDCTYNEKAGKCKNYCQYLTHCTKTSAIPFEYKTSIGSPYFSTACLNFVGDSQNKLGYSSQRHFSAPIAQCMKETLENVFYNRAGHSVCSNVNEYPDDNGVCPADYALTNDGFKYQEGGQVQKDSFFSILQEKMRDIIRMVLVVSVTFLGVNILLGKTNLGDKKTLIIYVLKLSLVMYFTLGNAWQTKFFDGVYGASADFSELVFKINAGEIEQKRDGCQFGDITLPNGAIETTSLNYPEGKEYLAMFDTLDCKLMRYLGFGPEVNVANIAKLVLTGFFSFGAFGIFLSLSIFILGFFMLAAVVRALHIFLSSVTAVILMVFISPLIIPLVLFEKTSNIFKGWFKQLISFTLQPMILFAYTAIFIIIMDKTLIGSATFTGKAPFKKISCEKNCYFKDTGLISVKPDFSRSDCIQPNEEFIDPMEDSVACLISIDNFDSWQGLSFLGITVPIIDNILKGDIVKKLLTLLKGAMVMALLYYFMDEISGIASQLIGGAALPGSKANPAEMFKKIVGSPSFSFSKGFENKGGIVPGITERIRRGGYQLGLNKGAAAIKAIRKQISGEKNTEKSDSSSARVDVKGSDAKTSGSDTASAEKTGSGAKTSGSDSASSDKK